MGESAGIQVLGPVDSLDFCGFGLWLSRGVANNGGLGAHRSVAVYLASSPFLPRLGHFAQ